MPTTDDPTLAHIFVACSDDDQQATVARMLRAGGQVVATWQPDKPLFEIPDTIDLIVASANIVPRVVELGLPVLALVENPHQAAEAVDAGAHALSIWPQDQAVLNNQTLCLLRSAQSIRQLRQMAYEDELTGLASRSYFMRHLEDLIRAAERENTRFCLLYLDLDSFKQVNDHLGHDAGDEFLRIIASRLASTLRRSDLAARIGGDEFCILATGPAPNGAEMARRCLHKASEPLLLAGRLIRPRLSIGIAYYPEDGHTASALLRAADRAMYEAKHNGGQRHVFHRPSLTKRDNKRVTLERRLRRAFEKGDFTIHYQPQVNLHNGRTRGFEALLRWPNQERLAQAAEFIGITERIGLIRTLDLWVLEQSCRHSVAWVTELGGATFKLSVNLSTIHFDDDDLTQRIENILQNSGWPPEHLELEIREEAFRADRLNHLGRLQSLGIHLAVDDFGNGCASLSDLARLPVNLLKIDGHFIRGLDRDPHAAALVGTLLGLARSMELEMMAEHVESAQSVQILAALGCNVAQGHYFSPPVPAEQVPRFLKRNWLQKARHIRPGDKNHDAPWTSKTQPPHS